MVAPSGLSSRLACLYGLSFASFFFSSALWFFGPSLHAPLGSASSLLWPLLTAPPLSRRSSPQVRCRIYPLVPSGSTECVSDDFWASLFPASLPPAPGLTAGSCTYGREFCYALLSASPRGYALRFATVAVIGSGWAPSIQQDSAHRWAHWGRRFRLPTPDRVAD